MATLHRLRPAGRCPQGRPWPHQPRSLVAAIEELSDCVRGLTAALVGDTDGVSHQPHHQPPAVDFDSEAAAQAEAEAIEAATADWDAAWQDLSVRELRALVRDLPIDRSSLPAPIELMRRNELLEALNQVQDLSW